MINKNINILVYFKFKYVIIKFFFMVFKRDILQWVVIGNRYMFVIIVNNKKV